MGRLQLIKPYSKQSIWTQHNILSLSDRTLIPYQIALIYFSPNVLPSERQFCPGPARQRDGTSALFAFSLLNFPEGTEQQFYKKKTYLVKYTLEKTTGKLPPLLLGTIIDQFNLISS